MPGFFDTLKSMGAAHLQHVDAIRTALQITDTQAARDRLGGYLQGLSESALGGFRVSLGLMLGSEANPPVRSMLQWIQANADALRAGHFARLTPEVLPPHGLRLAQVTSLIEPWVQLSPQHAQQQFSATMTALDTRGREEFAAHIDVLAMQSRQQLQHLQDNESSLWGGSIEDRIAYLQARISTGQGDAAQMRAHEQQQALVDGLAELARMARSWRPAAPTAARSLDDLLRIRPVPGKMDPARAAALTDVAGMCERLDRFRDMHRDVRRTEPAPAGSRAAALGPRVARPIWPGGTARCEPSSVAFAGRESLRALVAQACAARRLDLFDASQAGVDQATWLWRSMQRAGLVVIDLTPPGVLAAGATPETPLAQTYYQLGQAYALGTELLLTARAGTRIPFDIAQFVLSYRDEDDLARQLPEAIDGALYGVQTHGLSALMHGSPSNTQRRCFVVMPFSQSLLTTQTMYRRIDADLSAAGVEVVRGDEAVGQEIVASIWEETARASHVLVDLTDYNLNVCLELGMADAMGRDTLLIGAEGTAERRFPAIDKRRIHHYGESDASQQALRDQVRAFVQRAPTRG